MIVLRALMKGVAAIGFICSCAFSFAPATATELAVLGPDHGRLERVQRRLAVGLRDYAPEVISDRFAQSLNLPPETLRATLDVMIDGLPDTAKTAAMIEEYHDTNGAGAVTGDIRAGGARFVRPD